MTVKTITREQQDRMRGQLRNQIIDLVGDYDALLAEADAVERERVADKVFH